METYLGFLLPLSMVYRFDGLVEFTGKTILIQAMHGQQWPYKS